MELSVFFSAYAASNAAVQTLCETYNSLSPSQAKDVGLARWAKDYQRKVGDGMADDEVTRMAVTFEQYLLTEAIDKANRQIGRANARRNREQRQNQEAMTPSGRDPLRKQKIRDRYVADKSKRSRYSRRTMMAEVDSDNTYWDPTMRDDVRDFNHCVRYVFGADIAAGDVRECHPQNKIAFAGLATPTARPAA